MTGELWTHRLLAIDPTSPRKRISKVRCPLQRTDAKGDRRRPRTDGRAVLRPHSTSESGEPQGFRKERPRHPLEGRGKQGDVSVEGNISETQNSRNYVHKNRQNI